MPARILLRDLLGRAEPHQPGDLHPAVALLDDPHTQSQQPLYLPLDTDGHVAVYGAPGTGKNGVPPNGGRLPLVQHLQPG